jgi:hypothetical protein
MKPSSLLAVRSGMWMAPTVSVCSKTTFSVVAEGAARQAAKPTNTASNHINKADESVPRE